jgi:hypothetical protein
MKMMALAAPTLLREGIDTMLAGNVSTRLAPPCCSLLFPWLLTRLSGVEYKARQLTRNNEVQRYAGATLYGVQVKVAEPIRVVAKL